jgi:hypothetical protein
MARGMSEFQQMGSSQNSQNSQNSATLLPKLSRQQRRYLQRLVAEAQDETASPERRVRAIAALLAASEHFFPGPVMLRDPDGRIVYADAGDGSSPALQMGMTAEASALLAQWHAGGAKESERCP